MTNKLSLYDNTRILSFKTCPRKYYFEHIRHWRVDETSKPLVFGSSWHAAMDVVWDCQRLRKNGTKPKDKEIVDMAYDAFVQEWTANSFPHPDEMSPDNIDDFSPRTPHIAREMLFGYLEEREHIFSDMSFNVIAIEQPFAVPLDPDDPSLFYIGRLDKVFSYRKEIKVGEHKTTTSYKKNGPFRADFIDSFAVSSQIDGYVYALRTTYGNTAREVWIDGALVHKSEHSGFLFIPESRSDSLLDQWLWETRVYIDEIEGNREVLTERSDPNADYLPAFKRNTNSCVQYGRCPFMDICRAYANPEQLKDPPLGYKRDPWSPFDVLKLEKLGFTIENTTEPKKEPVNAE